MQRQSLIQRKFNRSNRQGAMLPFIAVAIIILFVACAIGIDIARMHVTRSELRTATDAAARAAMEALSREQNQQSAVEVPYEANTTFSGFFLEDPTFRGTTLLTREIPR